MRFRSFFVFLCGGLALFFLGLGTPVWAQLASLPAGTAHPLAVGASFPDLPLQGDLSPQQLEYLGLGKSGGMEVNNISAKVVVLVVFSMYCPHCQREAPILNELYRVIETQGAAQSVKLIGLGAGNSKHEVAIFKNKFDIPYPLFVDPDFAAHKKLGEVGTPYFYVLGKDGSGYKVLLSRLGRIESPEAFFNEVKALAKL